MPFRGERASPRTRCVRKLLGDVRSFFRSFRAHFTLGEHISWNISCYHWMCLEPWKNYSRRRNPVWRCHITAEEHPLAVYGPAFPPQKNVQPPVSPAPPFFGQLPQAYPKSLIGFGKARLPPMSALDDL